MSLIERRILTSPEKPRQHPITLSRKQTGALLEIFAQRFLPPDSKTQTSKRLTIVTNASKDIGNLRLREDIEEVEITNPENFLASLAEHKPETELDPSILGSGKKGIKAAQTLNQLSREFDTIVIHRDNFNKLELGKLSLELQLLIFSNQNQSKIQKFTDGDGSFFFVKRRGVPPEIIDTIYELSLLSGRRLDWLDDWFGSRDNGNNFDVERYFGRLPRKEKKRVNELLAQLSELSRSFFQLIPVDKDGNVDQELENQLNSPFQNIENRYRNLLITQADLDEELKAIRWAFVFSIPGIFVVSKLLATYPVLARSIPPILADILTLWAEASPFINRNLPYIERVKKFARLIKDKYKTSLGVSLVLSLLGSELVELLENANKLIAAGFAYAFIPFVGALTTTFQSFLQEYQLGKELREKAVKGYEGLTNSQLAISSLLKTVRHPARLYLLLAGFLGVGEGVALGAFNLLNNPLALTYVGELNESVLTLIGLLFHLHYRWREYHRQLKLLRKNQGK